MTETDEEMSHSDLRDCDDRLLLSRSCDGDVEAFGELVRRHQRAALRVATVIIGSTEEANDIVQDAFVKTNARLSTYRARGSVRSWMLRIVANEAKNHGRGRARRRRRDQRDISTARTSSPGADIEAIERIESDAAMRALQQLGASDRDVLGCRFVVGLDEGETAAVLGLPRGTVKSRTSRALGRLRVALDTSTEGTR